MESFESISNRAKKILDDATKQMERTVIEQTNLLVDYIRKFINQIVANANPPLNLTESRSVISHEVEECEKVSIDVENCVPYINYLDDKKHQQIAGLSEAFQLITKYFDTAIRKCDSVLSKHRCKKLIVSSLTSGNLNEIFMEARDPKLFVDASIQNSIAAF